VISALFIFTPAPKRANAQTTGILRIYGAVSNPLNLTYEQLLSFPMVSEKARLKCVAGQPDVTYNWTGIPLFYLLTLAQIKPEAYKVVITSDLDGFSSDLFIEDALKPTTILALEANGTTLPAVQYSPTGLNRLIVPGMYGYKWVSGVDEINVTTNNALGTFEGSGYSDEATVPDYGPMPALIPPLQTFSLTYGNRTFEVDAFTNASITSLIFDPSRKTMNVNVTVLQGTSGFVDFILAQNFLKGPYDAAIDEKATSLIEVDTNTTSYVYITLLGGFHTASISGTEFFGHVPEIILHYKASTYAGQNVTFDASNSVDIGTIISYDWSFGDGSSANGTKAIVSHSYSKQGTYQVRIKATNNEDISSFKTVTVTVSIPPENIFFPVRIILATILILIIFMFAYLLVTRKKTSHIAGRNNNSLTPY
jgi:hypothetical protein